MTLRSSHDRFRRRRAPSTGSALGASDLRPGQHVLARADVRSGDRKIVAGENMLGHVIRSAGSQVLVSWENQKRGWCLASQVSKLDSARHDPAVGGARRCPTGMRPQSLLFTKDLWTPGAAKVWIQKHGYRAQKAPHVTDNYVRVRLSDPENFSTLRTIPFGAGIKAVVGCLRTIAGAR